MSHGKSTDITVREVRVQFEPVPYRAPLKFGGRVVSSGWLVNAEVVVEGRLGKRATGYGSMPVGNVWAWPSTLLEPDRTELAMKEFSTGVGQLFQQCGATGHPLEIEAAAASQYGALAVRTAETLGLPEGPPILAQLVSASPVDAAVHDAYGRLHQLNAFDTLSQHFCNRDLADYLDDQFRGEYADQYTLRAPAAALPLYHLVGALDPLTTAEVTKPVGDGLPETLGEWILFNGLTHLKIKLNGDDLEWDVNRVLGVENATKEAQAKRGVTDWKYSLDFNEKCRNVRYLLDFIEELRGRSPSAFSRISYIEQPTARNLSANRANVMHDASRQIPVVIDESLVDLDSLFLAREMGYTGVALKACKGQSQSVLFASAARHLGMFLCVQDLTCPGASLIQSASLAAHVKGVQAIESNGRQYCPAANKAWEADFPGLFLIKGGMAITNNLNGLGLGAYKA